MKDRDSMAKEQNNLIQIIALAKTLSDNSELLNEIASIGEDEYKLEQMKKRIQGLIIQAKLQAEDIEEKK